MNMKTAMIFNPIGGRGKSLKILPDIRRWLENQQIKYDFFVTKSHGDAYEIARFCVLEKFKRIVLVGGDGTVNEVRYRRWKAGKWGESVLLASEKFAVNHVIAPAICPPDYVAIFWDELKSGRSKEPCALRFMRIPNK